MTDTVFDYQSTNFAANFKTIFQKPTEIALNLTTPYRARVRKSNDFTGEGKTGSVHMSLGGGRGSGSSLPASNDKVVKKSVLSKVETHGKYIMNRKTLIAGSDEKGSFGRSDKLAVKGVVDSVNMNIERMCFGKNALGTIDTGGVSGTDPYTLTISDATWVRANWMIGDYVNVGTGDTDQFGITAIDADNKAITVARITGTQIPAAADEIFLQNSEDEEIVGYADCFDTAVTSLFGITKQEGWQPHLVDASAATVSMDFLADAVIDQDTVTGKAPTEIHCSPGQFKKLLASVPNPQYYIGVAKHGEYKMSYKGLALLSPVTNEEIPVFINRFIHDKEVFLLNNEESELSFAPKFGWFEEGPLRITGSTNYEYPFGGELAHYFHPAFQCRISNLAA